jgi:hypothetical protein
MKNIMLRELLYYFEGIDESIIKLNNYIDNDFEFIRYDLKAFEKKYKRRFRELILSNHPLGFLGALYQLRCFIKKL